MSVSASLSEGGNERGGNPRAALSPQLSSGVMNAACIRTSPSSRRSIVPHAGNELPKSSGSGTLAAVANCCACEVSQPGAGRNRGPDSEDATASFEVSAGGGSGGGVVL